MTDVSHFSFVQFEFGFLLGPPDGRYLRRLKEGAEPDRIVVIGTLGAPQRRRRGKRPRATAQAEPEPVPTQRVTLIAAEPFGTQEAAEAWLGGIRGNQDTRAEAIATAAADLNGVLRAWRAAATDPYAADVSAERALIVRAGYGLGDQVANGHFSAAYELPARERRRKRRVERLAPHENFAARLGAREPGLASDELVLRARADLDAGRQREAALQARVAFEAVLRELTEERAGEAFAELPAHRTAIGEAANAALDGEPGEELVAAVEQAIQQMERALRRYRATSPSA